MEVDQLTTLQSPQFQSQVNLYYKWTKYLHTLWKLEQFSQIS